MARPISVVLVGGKGYGAFYLSALRSAAAGEHGVKLMGLVDPAPPADPGVPVYEALDAFHDQAAADLAVISSPIHHHCAQTCSALAHGSDVLCEKPAAATVQEVDRMIETAGRTGQQVAVGFQWSFSEGIRCLKRDILNGRFGRPRRLKSLCLWPRGTDYYRRNEWAGRQRLAGGTWVLDGPVNNAMAHDLHNLLYLLGTAPERSVVPVAVEAECYRANDIEAYDTASLRIRTAGGAEVLFFGSHAVRQTSEPIFEGEFERATVSFAGEDEPIRVQMEDGTALCYPSPNADSQATKLWACADAVRGGEAIPCGLPAARCHTLCVNGMQEAVPAPGRFPATLVRREEDLVWVDGLSEQLRRCYQEGRLPGEMGIGWARGPQRIDLEGYTRFPARL